MFLIRVLLLLSVSFTGALSFAQNPREFPGLETGSYRLVEGNEKLCQSFSIRPSDLKERIINVGGRYQMLMRNAKRQVESDLDANCEFVEEATKETSDVDTVLTRSNSEVCGGVAKTKTVSKFLFRGDRVWLDHAIQDGPRNVSYRCAWQR
ncbi:MAG: hypothetical protein KF767_18585 [Bdellovibrionaceae bacterium]|nr:hypothetical protein [Pseudobdellovibrionaceae bacterium]